MRRRSSASIVASPVLVGAVTVLVVIVAVFLAYNANNGLPFVPTRELNVEVPNGSNLVKGNDVREGGFRVGVVESLKPGMLSDGTVGAVLKLKLDQSLGAVPVTARFTIRPRSALGLKYVQLTRGPSKVRENGKIVKIPLYRDGATVPLESVDPITHKKRMNSSIQVQFDDIYKTFDAPTRRAERENINGFGDVFAGRGMALNETIAALPSLLGYLKPVMSNLAAPQTQLSEFFRGLNRTAAPVAPVSQANVQQFAAAATTFAAFSRNPNALRQTISKSPPTLDVSTDSLRAQMPFLRDTAALSGDLNAASDQLRASLPDINAALATGVGTLRRSTALNDKLIVAFKALRGLARDPNTFIALNALGATVDTLNPQLRFYGPFVTVCNSWNYFWYTLGEHLSEEDTYGYAQRALLNSTGQQDNSEGSIGATEPANGEGYVSASSSRGSIQYWHGQPYPAAIDTHGNADCENGQRGYPTHISAYAGKDSHGKPFLIANDPHTPGDQGPTYKRLTANGGVGLGRRRVLPGQTFTREPQTGTKLSNFPGNN